jgi:hypothetical protein
MWTPSDYVKQYYLVPPAVNQNFTAQIQITSKTPGFQPLVYLQRNDVLGPGPASFSLGNFRSASPQRFTSIVEKPFYQALQTQSTFNVSLTNTPIIVTSAGFVNGVPRNLSSTVQNQTYWSITLYWVNHGFTDLMKAEFEIAMRLTPIGTQRLTQLHAFSNSGVALH